MKTKITCADALKQWRRWADTVGLAPNTVSGYHTYISAFLDAHSLRGKSPRAIDETHIDQFVNTTDSTKAATRNSRLNAIQSFFLVCVAKGYTNQNPSSLVRVKWHQLTFDQKEKRARVPFTEAQVNTLRGVDDPFWRVASLLADEFGLRLGDVASLEWASFDQPGRIIVWTDKHDRRIELPLPEHVADAINELPKTHPTYVFPEQHATVKNPELRAKLSTYFARVLKRQGISGRSFHCFRHTFASRHRKLGETVDEIRLKLGHVSSKTTQGYLHA